MFCVLTQPRAGTSESEADYFEDDHAQAAAAPCCPVCGAILGMLPSTPPHVGLIELHGTQYPDILPGPGDELVVSEKFRELWLRNSFRGIESFEPILLRRVIRRISRAPTYTPPCYFIATMQRVFGTLDLRESGFEWKRPPTCSYCQKGSVLRHKRIAVRSDVQVCRDCWIPSESPVHMCSANLRDACIAATINNVIFVPSLEYCYDLEPWNNEARIHELLSPACPGHVLEKRVGGVLYRYCPATNELAIRRANGTSTMFQPVDGIDYWHDL